MLVYIYKFILSNLIELFHLFCLICDFFFLVSIAYGIIIRIHIPNTIYLFVQKCLLCYFVFVWQIKLIFHFICFKQETLVHSSVWIHRFSYSNVQDKYITRYSQNGNEHDNDTFIMLSTTLALSIQLLLARKYINLSFLFICHFYQE